MTWMLKAFGLFAVAVIGLSILGLTELVALLAPPVFLVVLFLGVMPLARPGKLLPFADRRKARRPNYLGHYRNPFGTFGDAVLMVFAVSEISAFLHRPFGPLEAAVTFGLAFGALLLVGRLDDDLGELLTNVIAAPAVAALIWRVVSLPPGEALASKVVFGVAVVIVSVVLIGVWNLPRLPVLMFRGRNGEGPRPLAALALLELAATAAVPLHADVGDATLDIWANPPLGAATWVGAGILFVILAVATAYGPRFVTSLIGIALAVLTLQLDALVTPGLLS